MSGGMMNPAGGMMNPDNNRWEYLCRETNKWRTATTQPSHRRPVNISGEWAWTSLSGHVYSARDKTLRRRPPHLDGWVGQVANRLWRRVDPYVVKTCRAGYVYGHLSTFTNPPTLKRLNTILPNERNSEKPTFNEETPETATPVDQNLESKHPQIPEWAIDKENYQAMLWSSSERDSPELGELVWDKLTGKAYIALHPSRKHPGQHNLWDGKKLTWHYTHALCRENPNPSKEDPIEPKTSRSVLIDSIPILCWFACWMIGIVALVVYSIISHHW